MTDGYDISGDIALRWTSLELSDDKSTLVQVMPWSRQATSHYLNKKMDGVDRDDFLTAARPTTESSSDFLSVRSTLYSELADYDDHSQFAVHHPDLSFETGFYVRPVIYRRSDNVYGDSFYCVYLWRHTVTGHRWYCSTPPDLCTHDQIHWISYVRPFPVDTTWSYYGQSYWPIPA